MSIFTSLCHGEWHVSRGRSEDIRSFESRTPSPLIITDRGDYPAYLRCFNPRHLKRGAVPVDVSRQADRTLQGKMSAVWHRTNVPRARLSEHHRCRQVLYWTTALHACWVKQSSVQKNCESLRDQTKVPNTDIDQEDVSFCSKMAKIEDEQICVTRPFIY